MVQTTNDPRVLLADHPRLRIDRDDYNINVTANYGERLDHDEVLERYATHPGAGRSTHLYFHVPLCEYICHFCNYVKRRIADDGGESLDVWTGLLRAESEAYVRAVPWLAQARVESLYFGGGTATVLRPRHFAALLDHVRAAYDVAPDCEISVEGNPDNVSNGYVDALRDLGVNRFSLGVQSFQDEVTGFTGRGHDREMSLAAIRVLGATGRPYNVDMMFGLPHQTPASVREDMETLVALGVPTVTIYRLRNADRASMGIGNAARWNAPAVRRDLDAAGLFPSLDTTYDMRAAAVEVLAGAGYHPSPCGWWNAPGVYPDGNIPRVSKNKWERYDSMVAFGPGAYGWLTAGGEVLQTHNEANIARYGQRVRGGDPRPIAFGRRLAGNEALGTALGFAFKANQPIRLERFRADFGVDLLGDAPTAGVFAELLAYGFVETGPDAEWIRPTLAGEALHEEIISVYFHEEIGRFADAVCRRT